MVKTKNKISKNNKVKDYNKYWLLAIFPLLIIGYFWNFLAFSKMKCDCAWNTYGFLVTTIVSIFVFLMQIFGLFYLIKKQNKRILLYFILIVVISLAIFVVLMNILNNILT